MLFRSKNASTPLSARPLASTSARTVPATSEGDAMEIEQGDTATTGSSSQSVSRVGRRGRNRADVTVIPAGPAEEGRAG